MITCLAKSLDPLEMLIALNSSTAFCPESFLNYLFSFVLVQRFSQICDLSHFFTVKGIENLFILHPFHVKL